jgi:bifunctional non-homologous end joining protein LigD
MAKAREKVSRAASPTDEQLARYRSMRDFDVTSEPSGRESGGEKAAAADTLPFVIQKHAATRLHYDFRLGWNGVLKSWAVTKGPSYVPADKRLAVQVEDHPMDYGGFEGIIPRGQYGGGTVMLWDHGTWEPHVDVDEGLQKGSLKFALHGEKMKGNWALVRMGGRAANESKPNWLLIKEHDAEERAPGDVSITDEAPDSALSGRSMEEIARARDRVWQSNRDEKNTVTSPETTNGLTVGKKEPKPAGGKPTKNRSRALAGFPKETLPKFVAPQLASAAKAPPVGKNWIHELKLDGYRIEARIDHETSSVRLLTRTGLDWTHRMKPLAAAIGELPIASALLDGEVVVLEPDGTTSFANLQAAFQEGTKHSLTYFVFDVLHLDGHNLRELTLMERKKLLAGPLSDLDPEGPIRISDHLTGDAGEIFSNACKLGAEGIISKLGSGKYCPGRSGDWLKLKCNQEQEFAIGGFTLPSNDIHGVGALMLGYYIDGKLIYAGRSGTGFTQKTHKLLRDKLDKLRQSKSPFDKLPEGVSRGVIWVKPEMVAQIAFSTWTADKLIRQAAFKGLREDKPAKEVRLETPVTEVKPASHKSTARTTMAKPTHKAASDDGLPVRLTHPEKVLDENTGVTKRGLAEYYLNVADAILPYIADRPLTIVRCPDGSGKDCFYQKHKNKTLSRNFGSIEIVDRKWGKPEPYITLSTREAVVEVAQIGGLELHPWGSRNESLEQPDRIIIDLDPDEALAWETLAASALEVRKQFSSLGLQSFVKTTGGKGLHVVVPIVPEHGWPAVKQFAHNFVLAMERAAPNRFLTKMTKAARTGKIYLDYLRNERGSTAVAPYSPRARAGLSVAMPLSWNELKSDQLPRFRVIDFPEWRKRLSRDPWKELPSLEQRLVIPESDKA